MWLVRGERGDRGNAGVEALLRELDELRELDRQRQTHAPGSLDHEQASTAIREKTALVMEHAQQLDTDRGRDRTS